MDTGKVTGIVSVIEPTKTYGEKGFKKRLVVLEQQFGETWTTYIPIEFCRHDCQAADNLTEGDEVTIEYQLKGNKWLGQDGNSDPKYFLSAEFVSYSDLKKYDPPEQSESGSKAKEVPTIDVNEERPATEDVPF
tara:strand:- start:432 stop:833 length:402 start_codon:yes stop_codon:yes gene_type:complete